MILQAMKLNMRPSRFETSEMDYDVMIVSLSVRSSLKKDLQVSTRVHEKLCSSLDVL